MTKCDTCEHRYYTTKEKDFIFCKKKKRTICNNNIICDIDAYTKDPMKKTDPNYGKVI